MTRSIPPLPRNTILMCEVGSTAHGTGLPGAEDHDQMAFVLETPREVIGLGTEFRTVMQRTAAEGERSGPGDTDRTLYSVRTATRLIAAGNPSMIMTLWSPIEYVTPTGLRFREELPELVVSRGCIPRYRGYMQAQTLSLLGVKGNHGHGKRGSGRRDELIDAFGFDTKFAMHAARLGFQCVELMTNGYLTLPIPGPAGAWLRACRRGDISFDDVWTVLLDLDAQCAALLNDESIPPHPDINGVNEFLYEMTMGAP